MRVRMGHTPYDRYIYLGFDSEANCESVNQILNAFLQNTYRY